MVGLLLQALARQPSLRRFAESSRLGRRLSERFVAGLELPQALEAAASCRRAGLATTLDHLGENVASPPEAAAAAAGAAASLEALAARGLDANISVKLTQFGLDVPGGGETLAGEHLRRLARRARDLGAFIRVDMESSAYTEATLRLVAEVHAQDLPVGAVVQAYLHRSAADIERLIAAGVRLRLVKGAYREPAHVALQNKSEVDANFVRLLRRLLEAGNYPAIATHDPRMIAAAQACARELRLSADRFEFQMLYGIRRDLQSGLRQQGWRVRVYIPYGVDWYPYFMRRLAERPANLLFLLRNLAR